jgi:hypothetical protein
MNESVLGIAVLALTQAVTVFHQFLPPLTDVRRSDSSNPSQVMDVRIGEAASVALTLGIGSILSVMVKKHEPFTIAAISAAGLVAIYEYTLRSNPA